MLKLRHHIIAKATSGNCANDENCPFRHPPPVARVPCRHWLRNHGECWYAEHCNFLHPGTAIWSSKKSTHSGDDSDRGESDVSSIASTPTLERSPKARGKKFDVNNNNGKSTPSKNFKGEESESETQPIAIPQSPLSSPGRSPLSAGRQDGCVQNKCKCM